MLKQTICNILTTDIYVLLILNSFVISMSDRVFNCFVVLFTIFIVPIVLVLSVIGSALDGLSFNDDSEEDSLRF